MTTTLQGVNILRTIILGLILAGAIMFSCNGADFEDDDFGMPEGVEIFLR